MFRNNCPTKGDAESQLCADEALSRYRGDSQAHCLSLGILPLSDIFQFYIHYY